MGGYHAAEILLLRIEKSAIRQALGELVPVKVAGQGPPDGTGNDQYIRWAVSEIQRAREHAYDAAVDIKQCLSLVATASSSRELWMSGGWTDLHAFEAVLRLLCEGEGVPNFMPEHEENAFFVIYEPGQLQKALGRIGELLANEPERQAPRNQPEIPMIQSGIKSSAGGADKEGQNQNCQGADRQAHLYRSLNTVYETLGRRAIGKDNVTELKGILDFLTDSVLRGADTAILFSDPP